MLILGLIRISWFIRKAREVSRERIFMKIFKRILLFVITIILSLSVIACSGNNDIINIDENGNVILSGNTINVSGKSPVVSNKETPVSFARLTVRGISANNMPIGGFFAPSNNYIGNGYKLPSLITDEIYKKISDCGVNYLIDFQNDFSGAYFEEALGFAEKYSISTYFSYKNIVSLQNINTIKVSTPEEIATALEPLLQYKHFAGLYGRDEPSANYYPYIKQAVSNFRQAQTILGENAKDLGVYINLFPQSSGTQLSGDEDHPISYDEYLDGFFGCDPFFVMFDMYPIAGLENTVNGNWLKYLGMMNQRSKDNGLAWQGFAQAGGNFFDVPGQHRVANKNEMFYDVNTMLAFGAKGINYFPCCFPTSYVQLAPEDQINDNSLLNKYGSTTPQYYYAQEINANIKAMSPYLMNSAHIGVILNGDGVCTYMGNDKMENFRQLKGVSGDPSLIGCFDYNGGTALLVINNTLDQHRGEITLSFDNNYEYTLIQRATTNTVIAEKFTLTLEAGECALVVIK